MTEAKYTPAAPESPEGRGGARPAHSLGDWIPCARCGDPPDGAMHCLAVECGPDCKAPGDHHDYRPDADSLQARYAEREAEVARLQAHMVARERHFAGEVERLHGELEQARGQRDGLLAALEGCLDALKLARLGATPGMAEIDSALAAIAKAKGGGQ